MRNDKLELQFVFIVMFVNSKKYGNMVAEADFPYFQYPVSNSNSEVSLKQFNIVEEA